ncbi:MAG: MFS transporter [Planctomycetes bacterium]|nr:MFS transporter [Planctomycetota bacterium]
MGSDQTTLDSSMPAPKKRDAASWILYDVANTVYAAAVSFLLMPYVSELGVFEEFSYLQTISMVLSGLSVPLMAAIADRTGRAATYLNAFTVLCVLAMAVFGAGAPMIVFMASFMVANFAYNSALVFYNALLPSVSTPKNEGLISGLGVGLGYLGTLLTLGLIFGLKGTIGEDPTFLILAGGFLVLAIPAMLFLHDRREIERTRFSRALVGEQFGSLKRTLKSLKHNKNLRRFLIANFLCVDVINTAIVVFVVYTLAVFAGQQTSVLGIDFDLRIHVDPSQWEIETPGGIGIATLLGAGLNLLALVAGVSLGVLADRWGAIRAMRTAAICLLIALSVGAVFSGEAWSVEGRDWIADQVNEYKEAKRDKADSFDIASVQGEWSAFAEREGAQVSTVSNDEGREFLVVEKPASGNATAFALVLVLLGAFGLAGVWTAGRKVLLELAPKHQVGEYFGLYGITVKISVFGTTVFGFLMARSSPQLALCALLALLIPGTILLFLVRSPVPASVADDDEGDIQDG